MGKTKKYTKTKKPKIGFWVGAIFFIIITCGILFYLMNRDVFEVDESGSDQTESQDESVTISPKQIESGVLVDVNDLYGTWEVNSMYYPDTANKATSQHSMNILIEFEKGGTFRTHGGCNDCSGVFGAESDTGISFSPVCSKKDCHPNEVDFTLLDKAETFDFTNGLLTLNLKADNNYGFIKFDKCEECGF